jgi:hypothetical protein
MSSGPQRPTRWPDRLNVEVQRSQRADELRATVAFDSYGRMRLLLAEPVQDDRSLAFDHGAGLLGPIPREERFRQQQPTGRVVQDKVSRQLEP